MFHTVFCNGLSAGIIIWVDVRYDSLDVGVVVNSSLIKFADSSWGTDDISISNSCKNCKSHYYQYNWKMLAVMNSLYAAIVLN